VQTRAKQYGAAFGRGKENLKYKELKKATKGFETRKKKERFSFANIFLSFDKTIIEIGFRML
jgi:hypothetical protein